MGLCAALALCACTPDEVTAMEEGVPVIGITVEIPGPAMTRGEIGVTPASNEDEYKLHKLKLWVFNNSDHSIVAYLDLPEEELPQAGSVGMFSVPVSREFVDSRPQVDVFALANEDSIELGLLDRFTGWNTLHDLVFGGSSFSVDPLVRIPSAEAGLPMSAMQLGVRVTGENPYFSIETLKLSRMVSKMRFVFCRMEDDDVAVKSVTVNGQFIPITEHVFSLGGLDIVSADGYVVDPFSVPGPSSICPNQTPEKLIYAGQDAITYENLIDDAVSSGILSDAGNVYLRESDKAITGYVNYTVGGQEHTRYFTNSAPGDFARNHSWILYGYFLSGRNMQLSVSVLPWDYNKYSISFREGLQTTQFTVDRSTVEEIEIETDHFDEHLLSGVTAKGAFHITTPEGGKLYIEPTGDAWAFEVKPDVWDINPSYNEGRVDLSIRRNPDIEGDLSGKSITLSFHVEVGNRIIDADSEILNGKVYRFIL